MTREVEDFDGVLNRKNQGKESLSAHQQVPSKIIKNSKSGQK